MSQTPGLNLEKLETRAEQTEQRPESAPALIAHVYDLCHEGVKGALYGGIQQPLLGVCQLADRLAGTDLRSRVEFMKQPESAEFGTARWHAQTIGSAVGMILPFMLAGKCKSAIMQETGYSAANTFTRRSVLGHSLKDATILGFGTDFVTRPIDAGESKNFWQQRFLNGITGSVVFASLTSGSLALNWVSGLNTARRYGLASMMQNPIVSGVISGVPGGLASAGMDWVKGGEISLSHLGQSIYSMSVAGGSLGLKGHIFAKQHQTALKDVEKSVASVKLEFENNSVKNNNLNYVEFSDGNIYRRSQGKWLQNGKDSAINSVEIDCNGNINIQSASERLTYKVLNDGGKVSAVNDFYDLYKGGNLDHYFANPENFSKLAGTPAFEILKTRHDRVVLNYGVEAIEKFLPEVTKEIDVAEKLSLLLTTEQGRAMVLDANQFEKHVPARSWLDASGLLLSKEGAMDRIKQAADQLISQQADIEFNHNTARRIAEYVVPQSIINSGRADVFDDTAQFSRRRERDLARVTKTPEKFLGFHLPEQNVPLIREIYLKQSSGLVPAEFEAQKREDGTFAYTVSKWRRATAEEAILPLSELTKTLKIIDYGFKDGNGNPSFGKISLGVHDSFDHLALFQELSKRGFFAKDTEGRGYKDLMKEFGSPHATDMFNRESELIASIGFEWRAFSIMPKEGYDPPVSLQQIRDTLKAGNTANQRAALKIIDDVMSKDPLGVSEEGLMLRHQFYNVERELKEQERQTGLTIVRPDFGNRSQPPLAQISTLHPEYAAFIVEVTNLLGLSKDAKLPFSKLVAERNLLYEEYLQRAARGAEQLPQAVPTEKMLPNNRGDIITPEATRNWMEENLGYNSRRAAQRKPYAKDQ